MNKITILFLLLIFTCCVNSQSNLKTISGEPITDVSNLLHENSSNAEIMDGIKQNPRQAELTVRLRASMQENRDWFMEYIKTVPKGEKMPYHKNFGITEEEYSEFLNLSNDIEIVSTGQENLQVFKTDSLITFKSIGKLEIYNHLKINLKSNKIYFKDYVLDYSNYVDVTDNKNGLKSKWKGHTWVYEFPKDIENVDLTKLESLTIIQCKFTIGKLERNGKTYMSIKDRKISNGVREIEVEVPVLF